LMVAIGYYHSHTHAFGSAYQQKVLMSAEALFRHQMAANRRR
jgi:hypothetical protein